MNRISQLESISLKTHPNQACSIKWIFSDFGRNHYIEFKISSSKRSARNNPESSGADRFEEHEVIKRKHNKNQARRIEYFVIILICFLISEEKNRIEREMKRYSWRKILARTQGSAGKIRRKTFLKFYAKISGNFLSLKEELDVLKFWKRMKTLKKK